jgi:hypothetical protein
MTIGLLMAFATVLPFGGDPYLPGWCELAGMSMVGAAMGLSHSFRIRWAIIGAAIIFIAGLVSSYLTKCPIR